MIAIYQPTQIQVWASNIQRLIYTSLPVQNLVILVLTFAFVQPFVRRLVIEYSLSVKIPIQSGIIVGASCRNSV